MSGEFFSNLLVCFSSVEPGHFFEQTAQRFDFPLGLDFLHNAIYLYHLGIKSQGRLGKLIEGLEIEDQTLGIILGGVFFCQQRVEVPEIDQVAVDVLALAVLGYELAVTQYRQLVALFEAIAVGFDEGDLGAIDPLFLYPGKILISGSLVLFDQGVPRRNLFVESGNVLERIIGGQGPVENAQKIIDDFGVLSRFAPQPSFGLGDLTIMGRRLVIFAQPLQAQSFIELHDVGELAAVFLLVVFEPHQRRLHDIDAGNVLGNREAVSVFPGKPLKVLDDIQEIAGGDVARFDGRGARGAAET